MNRLVFERYGLMQALGKVKSFIPSKATHPILGTAYFKPNAMGSGYNILGFNLESLGSYAITPKEINGTCIPFCLSSPAMVHKLLQSFTSGFVTFDFLEANNGDGLTLQLIDTGGTNSSYEIQLLPIDEYPEASLDVAESALATGNWFTITNNYLKTVNKMTGSFVADDATKFVLQGINFVFKDNRLTVQATDGHRASWYSCPVTMPQDEELNTSLDGSFIVKPEIILESVSNGQELTFYFDHQVLNVKGIKRNKHDGTPSETKFWGGTRLLDGTYPNLAGLIPVDFQHQVIFDCGEMIAALDRINLVADKPGDPVKFSFDTAGESDLLFIESGDAAYKAVAHEAVKCKAELNDPDYTVCFSLKYFSEAVKALKALTNGDIYLRLNENNQPAVFSLPGIDGGVLLMPVQVKG